MVEAYAIYQNQLTYNQILASIHLIHLFTLKEYFFASKMLVTSFRLIDFLLNIEYFI